MMLRVHASGSHQIGDGGGGGAALRCNTHALQRAQALSLLAGGRGALSNSHELPVEDARTAMRIEERRAERQPMTAWRRVNPFGAKAGCELARGGWRAQRLNMSRGS
jgi:hypothetical protein